MLDNIPNNERNICSHSYRLTISAFLTLTFTALISLPPSELSNSVFITFHSLEPIIWMHFFAHEQIIDLSGVLLDLSETICRRSEWITLESATQTANQQKKWLVRPINSFRSCWTLAFLHSRIKHGSIYTCVLRNQLNKYFNCWSKYSHGVLPNHTNINIPQIQ